MRIAHYYPAALAGDFGTAIAVRGWAAAMARAGRDVRLLIDGEQRRVPSPAGVEVVAVTHAGRGRLRIPLRLGPLLDDIDLLVLHGGWYGAPVAASLAARRADLPYVVTAHGVYHPRVRARDRRLKDAWARVFELSYLRRAAAVHVFFEEEVDHLERMGVSAVAIVAPNGFDPPEGRVWDGGSGGHILWLGRYDPVHKGLDLLVEARRTIGHGELPVIRLHGPDWKGRRRQLEEKVASHGLEGVVRVGGPVYGDEKWTALSTAVGFVYPSRWEAFGVAAAESMSLGVPTLVTPYPLGRFVAARRGAILSDLSAEALADGLQALVAPGASAVGSVAADVIRQDFSWDRVGASWLAQVERL